MKETKKILLLTALMALAVTPAAAQVCGSSQVNLIAGQSTVAGLVTVSNTAGQLIVTYTTSGGWVMNQTHLAVASSLDGIPTNGAGNPIPGQFSYKGVHDPAVTSVTYTIDPDAHGFVIGDTIYIAAHADVQNGSQTEGAWGQGTRFKEQRGNWAMYFTYTIQACDPPENEGFRTQTQGGWGTTCNGDNPGCYRDNHFSSAFPFGLTIGDVGGYSVLFTSSGAIEDFLPQGGKPSALSSSATDPATTSAGVLAGQVVALTLNVGFDADDSNFGASTEQLSSLQVKSSGAFAPGELGAACAGMYVYQVLYEANHVLSGMGSWLSASQVNECVSRINENFVDGTSVGDYLLLPY